MATPKPLLSLISLFSLFLLAFSSSKLTLPLSPLAQHPSSDPIQTLSLLASASISRAHHIKRPKSNSSLTKIPLYPHSYGGYSISLSFGTPPQTSSFVMDTGSSLVWFPCTSRYFCLRCSFPNIDPSKIPTFIPKLSSSSRIVGCQNPKCAWILGPEVNSECQNSSGSGCPRYYLQYGLGSTSGLLLSESLDLPGKIVPDFLVGCSILSIRQPAGIAGFGRGPESLPSQMGLTKFSYCLISRRFNDGPESSDLVLHSDSNSDEDDYGGISYTPFQKNPGASNTAYREYYYLALRKIVVGGKHVKIPYKYLVPGSDDNGGTIVDSGSTLTFMERPVFEVVADAFAAQVKYTRAKDIENRTGLKPCFDISKEESVEFPELVFQFKGGAKMALPLSNYFSLITSSGVVCLTIVTDGVVGPVMAVGPAVILGNFQQQNFYVEYDLEHERFGFRKQLCKK
ncbi:hypothetical protein M0R45_029931 [Rubus argutus]|uniref:Peptidase A1 domain-containing protein n=1 Tax=Rubus argutus TaxID=59490 RepID=A0AAW1WDS2_RUBAR